MSHTVLFTARAEHDLARLPEKNAAACLEFILGPLAENPRRLGKPLFGEFKGLHTARRGSYRIVYEIKDTTVTIEVIRIAHRANAYH